MSDILRDRIAAALSDHHALAGCDCPVDAMHGQVIHLADVVIEALDRDYIIVAPGTPLAQQILEWQLTDWAHAKKTGTSSE